MLFYKSISMSHLFKTNFIAKPNNKKVVIVPPSEHKTSEILSIHEATEVIGIRATQIENDSPIFTNYEGYDKSVDIATKELLDGKNPLILRREYVDGDIEYHEYHKVRDMVVPNSINLR